MHSKFHIGVQNIVYQDNKILLGKRKNVFGHGFWGFPGGHLEKHETIINSAMRELREETNLVTTKSKILSVIDPTKEINFHLQIGVLVEEYEGIIELREPEKCSEWKFFDILELPENIFCSSLPVLNSFLDFLNKPKN